MKTLLSIKRFVLAVVIFSSFQVSAQNIKYSEHAISLNGANFAEPLVNQWINQYQEENPASTLRIKIVKDNKDADINLIAHQNSEIKSQDLSEVLYLGRYVLLPVVNKDNPYLDKIAKKGLGKKEIKKLVFIDDFLDEEEDSKDESNVIVYARDIMSSTSITLAHFFESDPDKIKGKKIAGDDKYILTAIRHDNNGVAFSNLNYLYDIESRELVSGISLLPLNLKSQHKELLNANNIDKTIELLENNKIETIPVEKFGFVISDKQSSDRQLNHFISWILTKGQDFNNHLGFLKLETAVVSEQLNKITKKVDDPLVVASNN